ncbi:PREDICTED: lipocalin-15 isoform X1 [Hipposideros armiger]|uniref:Lipocalin-15 isoform X1 n=1 Tax=Hipposideros armiger TaxID=186990 RepID=A0A8B7R4J7_HIPAR|nr:PREDICTED: lipocalin-15 isoform X1 [Hipposideros armiger]
MTPEASEDTGVIVPNNGQRKIGVSGAQEPSAPPPARLPSPAAGLGYKAGPAGVRTQCQGPKTGVGMKSVLLARVLVLLWVSKAWTEVLVQPDFDAKKFSGLWFVVSMVSDCKVFLDKKDHLLMSTTVVTAAAEGNLSVHMAFPRADGCNQVDAEYMRVGSQGHFRVPALGYLDVRIVHTDYSSFAVVYIYKELQGALSTMVQLYSRTQEASPQALKAFQDFYPTVGLPDDMMVMLPKSDACSSGDKEAP